MLGQGQVCHAAGVPLLAAVPPDRRPARVTLLFAGLALDGFSDGLLVLADVGLDPWDVLHQGLSRSLGMQVGTWSIVVGALVLLCWLPLRQRPGIGTVCNVVTIGATLNLTLWAVPAPHGTALQAAVFAVGVLLNAVATGAYIGAGLGPGPRDGLSTGIAARGVSLRLVRTAVEVGVLGLGWLLGGTVGWGTVAYAVTIGPLVHLTIPWLRLSSRPPGPPAATASAGLGVVAAAQPSQQLGRELAPRRDGGVDLAEVVLVAGRGEQAHDAGVDVGAGVAEPVDRATRREGEVAGQQHDLVGVASDAEFARYDEKALVMAPVDVATGADDTRRDHHLVDTEPAAGLLAGQREEVPDTGGGHRLPGPGAYDDGGDAAPGFGHASMLSARSTRSRP